MKPLHEPHWLRPTLETDFGHPYLTDFGQTDFGQFYCFNVFLFF